MVKKIVGDGNREGITLVANRYVELLDDNQQANFDHVLKEIFKSAVNADQNPGPARGNAEKVVRTLLGNGQVRLDFQVKKMGKNSV